MDVVETAGPKTSGQSSGFSAYWPRWCEAHRTDRGRGLALRFKNWLGLVDGFNLDSEIAADLHEAWHRLRELEQGNGGGAAPGPEKTNEIGDHLRLASELFASLAEHKEIILRELFAAQREMIAYLPASRGAAAIGELRARIDADVPEPLRPALFALIDDAATKQKTDDPAWRDLLFAAKKHADEIVIASYSSRERLRDGIALLGVLLMGLILLVLISAIVTGSWLTFDEIKEKLWVIGGIGAPASLWIGFLCGALGGCMTGLFGFTVNRAAPGEYETRASTAIRPLIGATSGMLAAAILGSGLLNLGGGSAVAVLVLVSFVFGFSERLVMGAVESIGARFSLTAAAKAAPPGTSPPVPSVTPQRTDGK